MRSGCCLPGAVSVLSVRIAMKTNLFDVFAAGVLAGVLVVTHLDVVAAQMRVRTIPHQNTPIALRLMPGDEVVEMDYWADVMYVNHGNESREQTVARISKEANAIAVVRVTTIEPFLVEGDSWIRTRVTGVVEDLIKGGTATRNARFEAQFDGGEMKIKDVQVRAGSYPLLQPGSKYLVFCQRARE